MRTGGLEGVERKTLPSMDEPAWSVRIHSRIERGILDGGVYIIGVGHPFRSDDCVGSLVARDLHAPTADLDKRVFIIDAEYSPENSLSGVFEKRPGLIVVVDAMDMGLPPGSIRLFNLSETTYPVFSTHNIPLGLLFQYELDPGRAVLIGVQPKSVDFGEGMSSEVQQARRTIVRELGSIIRKRMGDEEKR